MFKRLQPVTEAVEFEFEGQTITARAGETLAAALLAAGVVALRQTAADGDARGPWCMIGNCFECRVEIDGHPNQQACLQRVRAGMRVRRQRGRPMVEPGHDG